jgi:pSer/pThr/pTyr-binding forkhead associated (FHA) protein
MDLKLRVTQGKNVGQEVAVPGKMFLIGRAEDCHLRAGSDLISRHHCVIIVENDYLAVRDFGSKNGTSVNGERVAGECELKHGDQLRVGPLEFVVQVSQGALGGKKKPPVHDAKEAAARTAAASDDDGDVSKWLNQPVPTVQSSTQDTQLARIGDTDEIDVGSTKEFGFPQPASPQQASPQSAAAKPAAKQAVPAPKSPALVPDQPAAAPHAAAAHVAVPHVAVPHAAVPHAAAPHAAAPQPAAVAAVAAPDAAAPAAPAAEGPGAPAEKKRLFGGNKKTYGKLPTQPSADSKNSVEAASNMLSKFRKRR